jgi:hypothetical protein
MNPAITALEAEVADLRRKLDALTERARLDAHAQAFLRGQHPVREGNYCLIDGFPTRVSNISSEGKWTYFNGSNSIEPFRVPPSEDIQRLYTIAEVAEIVAKVRQEAPRDLTREDVADLVDGLNFAIYGHEGRRGSLAREERWKALRDRLAALVPGKEDR